MTESGRLNVEYIEYNMSMDRLYDKISFADSVFRTNVCSEHFTSFHSSTGKDMNTSSKTLNLQINDYRPSLEDRLEHESHSNDPQHEPYGMYSSYEPSTKPSFSLLILRNVFYIHSVYVRIRTLWPRSLFLVDFEQIPKYKAFVPFVECTTFVVPKFRFFIFLSIRSI